MCPNLVSNNKYKFCSNICQQLLKRVGTIREWLFGSHSGCYNSTGAISPSVRAFLFETRGRKCETCGWEKIHPTTHEVPVQIDHIDGNWKNCRPENLRILCPNCHSLTPTFGNRNRGNGRPQRYKSAPISQ